MALLKWYEEDERKEEETLNPQPAVQVTSVQSGWQPTQAMDGADVQGDDTQIQADNYLMSDEKVQVDNQIQQRREAEAAAKAEAARQAEIARQQEANARANAAAELEAQNAADESRKYGGGEKKNEGGFTGFLKDVGSGIQQGLSALGDIAIQGGSLIGAIGKDDQELVRHMENSQKVREWLYGFKDINGENLRGTSGADEAASRVSSGQGSIEDWAKVGGTGLQAGIDATMFLNPARLATAGLKPITSQSASLLARTAANPAVRYAARDAAFFGSLQGTATFQNVYAETGGDLEKATEAALQDMVVGGTLQGSLDVGGHVVGTGARKGYESLVPVANKTINSLRRPGEVTPARGIDEILEDGNLTPVRETPGVADDLTLNTEPTINDRPLEDGNVSFEQPNQSPGFEPVADNLLPDENVLDTPVADGVATLPEQTPVDLNKVEPAVDAPAAPAEVTTPAPVADGVAQTPPVVPALAENVPTIKSEEVRALQEARAGSSQAEEAVINQRLQEVQNDIPREVAPVNDAIPELRADEVPAIDAPRTDENLPDDMNGVADGTAPDGTPLSREQIAQRLMPKLADNDDIKRQIANAVDMGKDVESPVRDILRDGGVKPDQAERIASEFDVLEKQLRDYNSFQEANQKAYLEGGTEKLDSDVSKQRSRVTRDMGQTMRRLMQEIDRLEGSRDKKAALVRNLTDLIGTRNASVLTSAGLLERNIMQEITANMKLAIKNPVKMAKSTFGNGNILGDTAKGELAHWRDNPGLNPVRIAKYVVGNTYRTAMIPTTALANTRRGAVRDELTKWAYKELEGRDLSSAEAHKLAGTAGNEMEALVNTFIGVENGMTNRGQATEAMEAWKKYIRSGDDAAKNEFLQKVEMHNSLADQMIAGLSTQDATRAKGLMAMKNLIFPFVRTATNLMKTTARQDLNPFAKSLLDEIRADQRGGVENAVNLIKSKLVDYGIMGGAAALASAGVLVYNDGDDVDKPRGWSIKTGDDTYVPVRATSLELPMALAGTAQAMADDIGSGKPQDWKYYAGMVTGSLPYIDQFNTTTGAADSLINGEDAGYAAKAYGVNMAKSFVPFSNNGLQAYVAGKQGESLNAKSVYDENMMTWLGNTVRKSYDPEFYNTLKDSRDAAGRVRTVDNQGVISNKTMNDELTREHNQTISDLVKYGRENGLGRGTQDMFNTYDTGKNNNFKSIQDAITFLDVEDGGKPDNAKKLEQNEKLADLAAQIRDGFYGETGSELLTLDGQNLKSDASVPNSTGSKNSRLPMSMQSIKNAIAATDLPEEDSAKIYEMSQVKTELYNQLKAKSISYEQYAAAKGDLEQQEINILSNSENYKKLGALMSTLDEQGFFNEGGIGSTKAGQTYLWNSLNTLLGSKGATPAANYPDTSKGFTPYGRGGGGSGRNATNKPGDYKNEGLKWTPVTSRSMATVKSGKYTPVQVKVKLGNAVKKNKTQNYSDRTI